MGPLDTSGGSITMLHTVVMIDFSNTKLQNYNRVQFLDMYESIQEMYISTL